MQNDNPSEASLRQRVFIGMAWSLLQTAGSRMLGILIVLILARVLGPAEFGIVTIAFVVVGGLVGLLDLGVGDVLARRLPQDQTDYDSAFWIVLGFSLVLAAATVTTANSLAQFVKQPLLPPLLWILAATLPLSAIEHIQGARMRAEMKFKPLALRTLGATTAGGLVGIAMAFSGAGYWALLAKGLVESVVSVTLMWVACSYRPGRQFSWSRWRELFSSGKHLLGSRMIDIVTQRYDSLVIGARLGPAALGLYSASFRLYSALMDVLFASVNRVTLPAFARIIKDSERVQRALLRLIRFTSFFTFPTFAAIAVVSEPLIITLLGSAWRDSAPILSALCIGGLLSSVSHFSAPLLNAKGRTDLLLRQMIVNAILVIVAVSVGSLWGAFGVAAGVVLRGYALLPVSLAFLQRATGLRPAKWLLNVAPPLFATCVSSGFLATIQWLVLPSVSAPWRLLALIAIFPPLHAVVVLLLIPGRAAAVADELAALWSGGTGMANALHRWEAMVRPRKD